jgi:hypothetical protein
MWRTSLVALIFLAFIGCGKNDIGVSPYYGPLTQAPAPSFYQPNYPASSPYYPGYNFNPQMPSGMPPQFYPWMPLYNYFYQQPQFMPQWNNLWNNWVVYANNAGCGVYNFPVFWIQYFPSFCSGGFIPFYQYMNTNFYSWVTPGIILPPVANPSFFWSSYVGMPLCTSGGFF